MDNSYELLNIETTQNIDIQYKIAGVGDRILAHIIDFVLLFAYLLFGGAVVVDYFQYTPILILYFIPLFFYHFLCELFLGGQSIGKKARKIKVIKVDGTRPSVIDYFSRWLLGLVEITMTGGVVALITILVSSKSQRIGDMVGKTSVVKLEKELKLEDTIYVATDVNYIPVFPQARYLTDKDANIIRELLAKNNGDQLTYQLIDATNKLKNIFLKKLSIKSDLSPVEFLSTLLTDYNHLSGKV
ncbi:MAG: RDD family protein [Candidatus Kapaibacterium sp.]